MLSLSLYTYIIYLFIFFISGTLGGAPEIHILARYACELWAFDLIPSICLFAQGLMLVLKPYGTSHKTTQCHFCLIRSMKFDYTWGLPWTLQLILSLFARTILFNWDNVVFCFRDVIHYGKKTLIERFFFLCINGRYWKVWQNKVRKCSLKCLSLAALGVSRVFRWGQTDFSSVKVLRLVPPPSPWLPVLACKVPPFLMIFGNTVSKYIFSLLQ